MSILTATILSFLIFFAMNGYWYLQKRRLRMICTPNFGQMNLRFEVLFYEIFKKR